MPLIQADASVYGFSDLVALDERVHGLLSHSDAGEHPAELLQERVVRLQRLEHVLQGGVVLQLVAALHQFLHIAALLVVRHRLGPAVHLGEVVAAVVVRLLHLGVAAQTTPARHAL